MLKEDSCGVDVGFVELTVSLRRGGEVLRRSFANTVAGHRALRRLMTRRGHRVRVCLESTGIYGLDLALELSGCPGVEVMVANPRAVRRFAEALMKRGKSDRIDADVLEQFAARMPFERWKPPSSSALQLRCLCRRIRALTNASTAEKNRLHAAKASQTTPTVIFEDLEEQILRLRQSVRRLTKEALRIIAAEPRLQKNLELLLTANGIAKKSAIQILGELSVLSNDLDARQWVAHAGLDPRHETSGTSVAKKPRITKAGNKHLRCALFMPALTARHHDPHLKAFADHLAAKGKIPIQVVVAVMRKLLVAIHAMLEKQQPFDGKRLFALT
jgi:transposase